LDDGRTKRVRGALQSSGAARGAHKLVASGQKRPDKQLAKTLHTCEQSSKKKRIRTEEVD
jgi:hypothetical protein